MVTMHHRTTKTTATPSQHGHGRAGAKRDGDFHPAPSLPSFVKAFLLLLAIAALYADIIRDERPETQTQIAFLPPLDPAANLPVQVPDAAVSVRQGNNVQLYKYNTKLNTKDPNRRATPCPKKFQKMFWMSAKKINKPVARALRNQGWQRIQDFHRAHLLWGNLPDDDFEAKPWQRHNRIPNYYLWNSKDTFVTFMMQYAKKTGKELPSIPETYRLSVASDFANFKHRLFNDGGLSIPWVLKKPNVNRGKGITMLGPNTPELETVLETVVADTDEPYIIQRYVCNEMTIDKKKFDFRIFWIVASLDPLIVMTHHGFVRIGNAEYSEQNFNDTTAHLTTLTFLASERKGSWDEFSTYLRDAGQRPNLQHIQDPVLHVESQVNQVIAEMVAAYRKVTFNTDRLSAENGFGFYCADFILDWDLDIFFIEPQSGCGLDEDYPFKIDLHNTMFSDMIVAMEEIWERKEQGLPTDNASLQNIGSYEIVYNEDWMFEYEGYVRSKNKKGCEPATPNK